MWNLGVNELAQALKGGGGQRFAEFVDRLVCGEAARAGLGQSEVLTQLRVNIGDGGVDTQVNKALSIDPLGWFDVPTCWQYKSEDAPSDSKLKKEIKKKYVSDLIRQGFGYRFCILGDLTPEKTKYIEDLLAKEARTISQSASPPKVINGAHLRHWAERFPSIVDWLRNYSHGGLHMDAWGASCRKVTPTYVANPEWTGIRAQILHHSDFHSPCVGRDPCLAIGGAAGVGKTRVVYETLRESAAPTSHVLYAADEQEAKRIAATIASSMSQYAILVADECTPDTRQVLNDVLRGHVDRIRVICLDNTGERLATAASQIWLSADALTNTDAILQANFPHVPTDRRHQYSQLSGGFVRLAADMCDHDTELAGGDMSGLLGSVERYVRGRLTRLKHDYLPLLSLIALFDKVGSRDDVQPELETLCEIAHCTTQDFRDAVRQVRESPGFVVQAGRYWYVTPEIVSRILFAEGWSRWAEPDLNAFLDRLPANLKEQFIKRVSTLGEEEVRATLGSFFRRWFAELNGKQLAIASNMSLAAALAETAPDEYLPLLRAVIDAATPEELRKIRGHAFGEKWGPRRTLVWLLERLVSFPEFFDDCEACLFRLALFENEPQIGNNATKIWQGLFSVYLSGTATPFAHRLDVLRARASASEISAATLAYSGFANVFSRPFTRIVGPPVVAGRLRPNYWAPTTGQEENECYSAALRICAAHLSDSETSRRGLAFDAIVNSVYFLLAKGLADDIAETLSRDRLTDDEAIRVLHAADRYLEAQEHLGKSKADRQLAEKLQRVTQWKESFQPSDFDGQLKSICSREPWDRRFSTDPKSQSDEIGVLAKQIIAEPSRLYSQLPWLGTREALSAERLGFAVGQIDEKSVCASMIFEYAIANGVAPLLRGYVRGLVFVERQPTTELLELMNQLVVARPEMAVDILGYGGDSFDAVNRVIQLVETKKISPRFLGGFAMGVGRRELRVDEIELFLPYFARAAANGDVDSARVGLRFLASCIWHQKRQSGSLFSGRLQLQEVAWNFAIATLPCVGGNVSGDWTEIIDELSEFNIERATQAFGRALLSEDLQLAQVADEKLTELAATSPDAVMDGFGQALLDQESSWRLQVAVHRDMISLLSAETVIKWIRKHGIDGAKAIARHIPPPYVDSNGNPAVPEILDVILREFDDDEVFNNFLAGCHSGDSWWGNGSEQFRNEAEAAKAFLSHPNPRIREWAKHEITERLWMAEREEQEHAERFLPS